MPAEANRRVLERRFPEVARALRAHPPAAIETEPDAARSGRTIAAELTREPADFLVVLGFAGGHHLEALLQRHAGPLFVLEPRTERLRAAVEARDPRPLLGHERLHLATDPEATLHALERAECADMVLRVGAHPEFAASAAEFTQAFVERLQHMRRAAQIALRTRNHYALHFAYTTSTNLPAILANPSFAGLYGAFAGRPAVVVAAGPSLDRQLETLARVQDRVAIVAIGQTAGSLVRAGIRPDLVHVTESQPVAHQLEGLRAELDLVLSPSVHPGVFDAPARHRFVATPASNALACWLGRQRGEREWVMGGSTVSQSAVGIASGLGARRILLIGQDLAFTGGRVYASHSAYAMVGLELEDGRYVLKNSRAKGDLFDGRADRDDDPAEEVVWVEGWGGGRVPTSPAYAAFIEHYRDIGRSLAAVGIRVLNCTEGGARIPGLEHRAFGEALAEFATRAVGARERILEACDTAPPFDPEAIGRALAQARRHLDRVEKRADEGLAEAKRAAAALGAARA
ncbi:MAG: DUF115 domain-containing protein, partial [Proteobacteria bacterium]|nr:DUF115 domain-containing protein [Pseudomonadota bacterium]